jgi:hypothetical protein
MFAQSMQDSTLLKANQEILWIKTMRIFETWIPSLKFKKDVKKHIASELDLRIVFYYVEIFCKNDMNFTITEEDMEKNNNKWRQAFSSFLDDCIEKAVYNIEYLSKNGKIEC